MPQKKIVSRQQIVDAAIEITRNNGPDSVTARSLAAYLGISTHPIFSYFSTITQIKDDVIKFARELYHSYILKGLKEDIPFLGIGHQYLNMARQEPELFKLLFLTPHREGQAGTLDEFRFTLDLVIDSVMNIYHIDRASAECYYRNLWLMSLSFTTLIVTGNCTLTDQQMSDILTQTSLSLCKAIKEVPGFIDCSFDTDRVFKELAKKQ